MKKLALILILLTVPAFAKHFKVNCASTNLATTYSTSSPSLALTDLKYNSHIALLSTATVRICVYAVAASASSAPTAGDADEHCIPPGYGFAWDGVPVGKTAYLRADGASCTTGIIDLDIW